MPLTFTGKQNTSGDFSILLEATDGERTLGVVVTTEVVHDYGLDAAKNKASEKFDAGLLEDNGSIRVTTSDF